jgi:hypothetical protein
MVELLRYLYLVVLMREIESMDLDKQQVEFLERLVGNDGSCIEAAHTTRGYLPCSRCPLGDGEYTCTTEVKLKAIDKAMVILMEHYLLKI